MKSRYQTAFLLTCALYCFTTVATHAASLRVLTWNIFMLPTLVSKKQQLFRSGLIPGYVKGHDVLMFNEAFDDDARAIVRRGIRSEYPHQTAILGSDSGLCQDGGVFIASRWPLAFPSREYVFKNTVSFTSDDFADKGVVYACIKKEGKPYHLFATHLQAGSGKKAVLCRRKQLFELRLFIYAQRIPANEAVIIGGDMNIDAFATPGEEARMHSVLDAAQPNWPGSRATFAPGRNALAEGKVSECLDYILYRKKNLQPTQAECRLYAPRAKLPAFGVYMAMSDHEAVACTLTYPDVVASKPSPAKSMLLIGLGVE